MAERHRFMDGKLHLYQRENSRHWQCSTFLNGKNWRMSTKEDSLAKAKDVALDWFFTLKGKHHAGQLAVGKTFQYASEEFLREAEALIAHDRGKHYIRGHRDRLRAQLIPFFGTMILTEIKSGVVLDYRVHRATSKRDPQTREFIRPAKSTIHQEIVTLRQILKMAQRRGWIEHLPDLSDPFRQSNRAEPRAWFTQAQYRALYEATRGRALNPPKERWRWSCEQLHDQILLIANSGLRPDEANNLEFRDIEIIFDETTNAEILEIEVRGKRGYGPCKTMPGAVLPFKRLRERLRAKDQNGRTLEGRHSALPANVRQAKPAPADKVFPHSHTELLNEILEETQLKFDRDGRPRTMYSLRHSYICFRLIEGADIYALAKNCRTSVEIIQKHYASHLKSLIDTAAINTMRPKKKAIRKSNGSKLTKGNTRKRNPNLSKKLLRES